MSLVNDLKPNTPIRFPHYERHYEISRQLGARSNAYSFAALDCREWYGRMRDRVFGAAASRSYLPLFRMGDGEYRFALAGRAGNEWSSRELSLRSVARRLKGLATGKSGSHRSGSPEYGFEEYTKWERPQAYDCFVRSIQKVSTKGILALALHDSPTYGHYIPSILNWFDANHVTLEVQNYYHVYAVYALMHGPDRLDLLRHKHVLVVTSLSEDKKRGIERGLSAVGVAGIHFLEISPTKSMFETINLERVPDSVDLCLVGAGVGSVSILAQLEPLGVPCLDVGFVLSTLANPDLRWRRPFCVPDDEFELSRAEFLPRGR